MIRRYRLTAPHYLDQHVMRIGEIVALDEKKASKFMVPVDPEPTEAAVATEIPALAVEPAEALSHEEVKGED